RGSALDAQLSGDLVKVRFRGVRVDPTRGLALGRLSALRLGVRRARLVLALPAVTDLLVGVLQRRPSGAHGALALAVLPSRRIMRLGEGALGLLAGPGHSAGQLALLGLALLRHHRHAGAYPAARDEHHCDPQRPQSSPTHAVEADGNGQDQPDERGADPATLIHAVELGSGR